MHLKIVIIIIAENNFLLWNGLVNKTIVVTIIIVTAILFAILFYSKLSGKWPKANDTTQKKQNINKPNTIIESEVPNIESQDFERDNKSIKKGIGYVPINVFSQQEPISYPYVLMPDFNCNIVVPCEGRNSRRGFKEDDFPVSYTHLRAHENRHDLV